MKYTSTRDDRLEVPSAFAIAHGISKDGGLFLPKEIPSYSREELETMIGMDYHERAKRIIGDFLTDFTPEEIADAVDSAYSRKAFPPREVTPIVKVEEGLYSLELWHGPTCAFKDMALQMLPHLLTKAVKKVADGKQVVILVATSGDTGKAALEGFKDVKDTNIIVFYPHGGVSQVQYLQMATQEGNNVDVYGVEGNFDDTQTMVKEIFTSPEMIDSLATRNMMFSSANSINWGRLLPQIVYYVSTYCQLCAEGELKLGEKLNIVVPTGNFGNILAAYYAKQMGVPIGRLICASNSNNVLVDFINTGEYDRRREFMLTSSPSMDILISSNLERLLYLFYNDSNAVEGLMKKLSEGGVYTVSDKVQSEIGESFYGDFATEAQTAQTIRRLREHHGYLVDTHTAVAFNVYEKYKKATGDSTKTVVVSTANPYKFSGSMLQALEPDHERDDSFKGIFRLKELTGLEIPPQLKELDTKELRFTSVCSKQAMKEVVKESLNLK